MKSTRRRWILAPIMVIACIAGACTTPPSSPGPAPGVKTSIFPGDYASVQHQLQSGFDVVNSKVVGAPAGLTITSHRDHPPDGFIYTRKLRIEITASQSIAPGSYPVTIQSDVCALEWEPYHPLPCPELHQIPVTTPMMVTVVEHPDQLEAVTVPLSGHVARRNTDWWFSGSSRMSADGRFVAFGSFARSLVPNDTNSFPDVFVRDRQLGTTTRVSVATDGTEGNHSVGEDFTTLHAPDISADGRFVVFSSHASNLVSADMNFKEDIFLHDTQTGITSLVSVDGTGRPLEYHSSHPRISADGRVVVFESSATPKPGRQIRAFDRQTGVSETVSVDSDSIDENDLSINPSVSSDGARVAFSSASTNLDPNGRTGHYVRDLGTGTIEWIAPLGPGLEISGDGNHLAFVSDFDNTPTSFNQVYLRNLTTGTTELVSTSPAGVPGDGDSRWPDVNHSGTRVVFQSSAPNLSPGAPYSAGNAYSYVRDTAQGTTIRISRFEPVDPVRGGKYPTISADGNHVSFTAEGGNFGVWALDIP